MRATQGASCDEYTIFSATDFRRYCDPGDKLAFADQIGVVNVVFAAFVVKKDAELVLTIMVRELQSVQFSNVDLMQSLPIAGTLRL